jgi:hypothetical protein
MKGKESFLYIFSIPTLPFLSFNASSKKNELTNIILNACVKSQNMAATKNEAKTQNKQMDRAPSPYINTVKECCVSLANIRLGLGYETL